MVAPIKHDADSKFATTGREVVKGGVAGTLGGALIGLIGGIVVGAIAAIPVAGIVGLLTAGVAALLPVSIPATAFIGSLGAAWSTGVIAAGITAGLGALGGAVSGLVGGSGYGALSGGLIGMFRSGNRIQRESEAYQARAGHVGQKQSHGTAAKVNDAAMAGMQQGYMLGYQEGQQQIVAQLQKMQEQAIRDQMASAKQAEGPAAKAHLHVEETVPVPGTGKFASQVTKCESKVEMVDKSREGAAAGQQLG